MYMRSYLVPFWDGRSNHNYIGRAGFAKAILQLDRARSFCNDALYCKLWLSFVVCWLCFLSPLLEGSIVITGSCWVVLPCALIVMVEPNYVGNAGLANVIVQLYCNYGCHLWWVGFVFSHPLHLLLEIRIVITGSCRVVLLCAQAVLAALAR